MATEFVAGVANLHRLLAAVDLEQGGFMSILHRTVILKLAARALPKGHPLPYLVGVVIYSLPNFYQLMETALPSDEQGMPAQLFADLALDPATHNLFGGLIFTSAVGRSGTRTYKVYDLQILGHEIDDVLTGVTTKVLAWDDSAPVGSTFTVMDAAILERLQPLLLHTMPVLG